MFEELLDKFDDMSISDKRKEIRNELLYLFMLHEKICQMRNTPYVQIVNDDIQNLISKADDEDEYLDGVYAYVEAIKEMVTAILDQE